MGALIDALRTIRGQVADWQDVDLAGLHFWNSHAAWIGQALFVAAVSLVLLVRLAAGRRNTANRVALPAFIGAAGGSPVSCLRHAPLAFAAAGIPFFVLALADPYTALTEKRTTFPGRRICIMIDASTSMVRWFEAPSLRQTRTGERASEAAFFTTVAAAERFVHLRREGRYRDLMALVEFGDQAYVVTPFTSDYDNILLSLSLIGDFGEFLRFPDQGTIIARAVEQGTRLFETFDFLDASGNILVLLSDGEDAGVITKGRSVTDVVNGAIAAKIPIYFIRVNHNKALGAIIPDAVWKTAVERTGGKFYAAATEQTILQAIRDVDRASTGRIDITEYVTQQPRFGPFALLALACWSAALVSRLAVPYCRTFP
ncbi:MAG: VWA domain-containing protein [Acidimicrobiia bacterium]|nr:VWA domain-containing protein [Acidimicrobiia bacterium]